jgi:hypothetical protein
MLMIVRAAVSVVSVGLPTRLAGGSSETPSGVFEGSD